jgi:hypothetical protein
VPVQLTPLAVYASNASLPRQLAAAADDNETSLLYAAGWVPKASLQQACQQQLRFFTACSANNTDGSLSKIIGGLVSVLNAHC